MLDRLDATKQGASVSCLVNVVPHRRIEKGIANMLNKWYMSIGQNCDWNEKTVLNFESLLVSPVTRLPAPRLS